MGLDIYIHKCKKEDYLLRKNDSDVLSWMCIEANCAAFDITVPIHLKPKMTQEQQKEHSCQYLTTMYGSQIYNWLLHNTDVSLDYADHVVFEKDAIMKLKDLCSLVVENTVEADNSRNRGFCQELLPILEGRYFSEGDDYDDNYLECVHYALDTLSVLLEHTDFENELVLVMASW